MIERQTIKTRENQEENSEIKRWWINLVDRMSSVWSKDRKEGEPRLNVKIFFLSHAGQENIKSLEAQFKECDIFIPELFGHRGGVEEMYNKLSEGEITPEEFNKLIPTSYSEFSFAEGKLIFDSQKPVLIIDIPNEHPLIGTMGKIEEKFENALKTAKSFDELLESEKEYIFEETKQNVEREDFIADSLFKRIESFLEKNPKYKSKKELKILLYLGSFHTSVFHSIKSRNNKGSTGRLFDNLPLIFSPRQEAIRSNAFTKSGIRDMVARSILENFTLEAWGDIDVKGKDFNQLINQYNDFLRLFSYEEIKSLLENPQDRKGFKIKLFALCEERKIEIPELLK